MSPASRSDDHIASLGADMPVITLTAAAPGPTAVLTANVHGDEYTGTAAILQGIERWTGRLLRGRLILIPSLNPEGMRNRTRACHSEDLNRAFPGGLLGTATYRHAGRIWSVLLSLRPIDLLLDLHSDALDALPYAILDPAVTYLPAPDRAALEARCLHLARATGLTCLHEHADARYTRTKLDRSLSGAVVNGLHAPAFTVEIGTRLTLDPLAPARMGAAVDRALHALGLLPPPDPGPDPLPPPVPGHHLRDAGPASPTPGLLHPLVRPGAPCAPQQPIARLLTLQGATAATLLAPSHGFVVAWSDRPYLPAKIPCCTWASTSSGLHPSAQIVPSR